MSDQFTHARKSASASKRWGSCFGSPAMEEQFPDEGSIYAKRGTCAHAGADEILRKAVVDGRWEPVDASELILNRYPVAEGEEMTFDAEMADWVDYYVERVGRLWTPERKLHSEQRVPIDHVTGEKGAKGTSDAVIVVPDAGEIIILDLKTGSGVQVDAENNDQVVLYAAGVIRQFEFIYEPFKTIRMVIIQPPKNHYSEWALDAAAFQQHVQRIAENAKRSDKADEEAKALKGKPQDDVAWVSRNLVANEENCRFCNAAKRVACPAQKAAVDWIVSDVAKADDFRELGHNSISLAMDMVGMVEDWCKNVRAECDRRLLIGERVPGWKVVEGKLGNRAWNEEEAVIAAALKQRKVGDAQIYDTKLRSVAQMEKQLKRYPDVWSDVQKYISRSPGKPSVAPASDPRPAMAISAIAGDFRDRSKEENAK